MTPPSVQGAMFGVTLGLVSAILIFRLVEITDEAKADWSEKETLLLLETIMHYGDDWNKVAQNVGGRTD